MKNKERRAKLDKLEEAIDEELSYDTYEDYPDENGRSRAQNSEQIEFLEINSERVVQLPKSFLKFLRTSGDCASQRKRASSLYLNKLL